MSRKVRNLIIFLFGISMLGIGVYSWVEKNLGDRSWPGIITEWGSNVEQRQTRVGSFASQGIKSLRLKTVNGQVKIIPADEGSEIKYEATLWARGRDAEVKISDMQVVADVSGETSLLVAEHRSRSVSNEGVDFVVYLPKGIGLVLDVVNGNVEGSLVVQPERPISVATVNGSIDLKLDTTAGADITATLVNGKITLEPEGRMYDSIVQNARSANAKVNGGGTPVTAKTVNGQIRLDLGR